MIERLHMSRSCKFLHCLADASGSKVLIRSYRVSHFKRALLWSCVQGRVFNTFSWFISQINAKGCANRLVESHFWSCHFWRENSNAYFNSALQTIKIKMRHFLMIMKRCEIVHTIFEYFALYVALKSYYLAWYSINNQIHQKCLIWILIVCSKLL